MARKPDAARRAEIVSRALGVIRRRGLHRTTMSHIARAMEMKRPTLYWYFNDLTEICDAILVDTQTQLERFIIERVGSLWHPLDVLAGVVQAQQDFYEDRRDVLMVLLQLWGMNEGEFPARFAEKQRAFVAPARQRLVSVVAAGIDAGLVTACDPEKLVDLVLAVGDGAMVEHVSIDFDVSSIMEALKIYVLDPLRKEHS